MCRGKFVTYTTFPSSGLDFLKNKTIPRLQDDKTPAFLRGGKVCYKDLSLREKARLLRLCIQCDLSGL